MKSKLKQAFTMAEVLLVVGIIGVTAALAIPNIKNNGFNEEKYVMLLRTTIPMLQAAEMKAKAEYGDKTFNLQHMAKFLSVAKVCSSPTDCFANKETPITDYNSSYMYSPDIESVHLSSAFEYGIVLSNGVVVEQLSWSNGSVLVIDLDGKKGPATVGIDIYLIGTSSNTLFESINLQNYGIAWPMVVGNMDYLRCYDDLSWDGKHTCD